MAYNEQISDRIREALSAYPAVDEKQMFGGVCYMLNGKMCMGVIKNEMMCRIGPDAYESALAKPGCREMVFTKKPMKGYIFVDESGMRTKKDFQFWVDLCVKFNKVAKPSKRRK